MPHRTLSSVLPEHAGHTNPASIWNSVFSPKPRPVSPLCHAYDEAPRSQTSRKWDVQSVAKLIADGRNPARLGELGCDWARLPSCRSRPARMSGLSSALSACCGRARSNPREQYGRELLTPHSVTLPPPALASSKRPLGAWSCAELATTKLVLSANRKTCGACHERDDRVHVPHQRARHSCWSPARRPRPRNAAR